MNPPPHLHLKAWILQRILHHKSLKGCILKSLLLLYCYWDILSENRHKEPGPRLQTTCLSAVENRSLLWANIKSDNSRKQCLTYSSASGTKVIFVVETLFDWIEKQKEKNFPGPVYLLRICLIIIRKLKLICIKILRFLRKSSFCFA